MANFQWINNKSVDFYKTEHCPYMRDGEGSILETFELKSTFSFLFLITQHIKELASRKFKGLLRIIYHVYMLRVKQGGTEQCLGFVL